MKKTQGLVIINTGDGKGKTTAALGVAFRAAGNGMRVLIRQFIKGSWTPGELKAAKAFPELIDLQPLGEGFVREKDEAAMVQARAAMIPVFRQVCEEVITGDAKVAILDEALYAVKFGLILEEELLDLIEQKRTRRPELHLLLTGRAAPPALIEAADLVTEMTLIKHPYEQGIPAQVGIEF
ncbi:MAG: cob(I)yrinic acid a,c-diamide adenosyltransferase [Planctomycetota bacterium]|jgi:cob(I)alamin adenosyltransferase